MTKENEDMEKNFASKPKAQCTHRCVSTHRGRAQVTTIGFLKIQRLKCLVQLYILLTKSGTERYQLEKSRSRTFISEGGGGEEGSKKPWNLTCMQGFTTDLKTKGKRRHGAEKKIGKG